MGTLMYMARKDVAFKIRVEETLRREFVDTCQREDRPAAQVIREFMREYVERRREAVQRNLFDDEAGAGAA